jgi:hypothetical protein
MLPAIPVGPETSTKVGLVVMFWPNEVAEARRIMRDMVRISMRETNIFMLSNQ